MRGGSHNKAMDAREAVASGHCTVLTSDYHYPSPLHAAFALAAGDVDALAHYWPLVSANAARAAGLEDRGSLTTGKRADLILVDMADMRHPEIVATMVGGRIVYARRALEESPLAAPVQATPEMAAG